MLLRTFYIKVILHCHRFQLYVHNILQSKIFYIIFNDCNFFKSKDCLSQVNTLILRDKEQGVRYFGGIICTHCSKHCSQYTQIYQHFVLHYILRQVLTFRILPVGTRKGPELRLLKSFRHRYSEMSTSSKLYAWFYQQLNSK